MDNTMSEPEAQLSFRSPPRRRRSTFFERRESMAAPQQTENLDPNICKQNTEEKEVQNKELERYLEQLSVEKDQWKKEAISRRDKYHDLRQQYQLAAKAPSRSRIAYSALTDEDIEFLKSKPNLSKLIDTQAKLHKSVKESQAVFRRVNDLDDVILDYCEDKVNKVTEYILEHSVIEETG